MAKKCVNAGTAERICADTCYRNDALYFNGRQYRPSVGSLVALVSAMSGMLTSQLGLPTWVGIVVSLVTGLIAGMWQGFWIAFVKVPPFITILQVCLFSAVLIT